MRRKERIVPKKQAAKNSGSDKSLAFNKSGICPSENMIARYGRELR